MTWSKNVGVCISIFPLWSITCFNSQKVIANHFPPYLILYENHCTWYKKNEVESHILYHKKPFTVRWLCLINDGPKFLWFA